MTTVRPSAISTIVALLGATIVDIVLKYAALAGARLGYGELRFELFKNPGIAFSLPVPLTVVTSLTVVFLIGMVVLLVRQPAITTKLFLAAAFLGAVDNLVDRLLHGFTTDYFVIHQLAINVADILIVVGIVGAAWYTQNVQARQ